MSGSTEAVLLVVVVAGRGTGIVLRMVWFERPAVLCAVVYLGCGWLAVVHPVAFLHALTPLEMALLATGGMLYTAGAVVFAIGRPNPWPATFGFHEVWHLCVVAAALCHWIAIYVMACLTRPRRTRRLPGLDELEVEVDLDDVAEHRAERAEAEAEVLAPQLAGRLEAGMAGAVDEVGDAAELDGERRSAG